MKNNVTLLISFLGVSMLFGGGSSAQTASGQAAPTGNDSVREQYTPSDFARFLERERNGEVSTQAGPVLQAQGQDRNVLLRADSASSSRTNNNAGATGTGNFTQSGTTLLAFGSTVVVGFNDSGSYAGGANKFTGFSYSTDGGATFTDGGTLPTNALGDAGDPILARDETTSRIYFATLAFASPGTIQVFRSDDNGVTWGAPVNGTPGGSSEDKQWMTVDNFPGPGNGNVYVLSRRFGAGPGIYFFRSTDAGSTFGPTGGTLIVADSQGAFVTVGPDHAVYAFWYAGSTLQMRKSTDQGLTFGPPVTVVSGLTGPETNGGLGLTGVRQGTGIAAGFRSNSFPHVAVNPVSGHLYVTFNDNPASVDKADVYMVMSTDGGATWGPRVRVNDDATTTDQWQPTLAVTPDGASIGIFYYSRQEDPANNNLFRYYGRTGIIAGSTVTFGPSFPISDVPSLPEFGRDSVLNSVYMGDYDFAVATPGMFHVTWADNRDDLPGGNGRKDPNVYYSTVPAGGRPVCDANGPYEAQCGRNQTLDGSGSSDPDGGALTFDWSGPFSGSPRLNGGATPVVVFTAPAGDKKVSLTVEDDQGFKDSCEADVKVVDTIAATIQCNTPTTITPPNSPVSFTATAADGCSGAATPVITGYQCYKISKKGKVISKTSSCVVSIAGDTISISDVGGVDTRIEWTAQARDSEGNLSEATCGVSVISPAP